MEALRLSLHELEGLLEEYTPMMGGSMEKAVDKAIEYGVAFAGILCRTGDFGGCERNKIPTSPMRPFYEKIYRE